MRLFLVFVFVAAAITAFAQDWVFIDDFPCEEVANEQRGFGLAYRDNEIFVACWNYYEPWYTNLFVYDLDGNYQGEHFAAGFDDIDISGIDWKSDSDHGGEGWYGGGRQAPDMYLIAEDGSSYDYFAGPPNFTRMYGVAHNPDNDMLYVSDFMSGWAGWGYLDGSGHVTSWTEEAVGLTYSAMKYASVGRSNYLMAIYRDAGYQYHELHIFTLNSNGEPRNIYSPDITIEFGDAFYYLGDFDYDGDYMWLLDQNKEGEGTTLDFVAQIDLPGFDDGIVNIQPASLGSIKAQFR
jgi:hypothetical protein